VFADVMAYLWAQNSEVETLYRLEKSGKFRADGTPGSLDGRDFIDAQLEKGGRMLGSLWLTAWRQAGPDLRLRAQLIRRQALP
jgi:hypothetical protein